MKHLLAPIGYAAALAVAGAAIGWWTAAPRPAEAATAATAATGTAVISAAPTQAPLLGSRAACDAFTGLPAGFGPGSKAGMLPVPPGRFTPGSSSGYADEVPAGPVNVPGFWIDRTEVTNAQFAAFVQATAYMTDAERQGSAVVFNAPPRGRLVAPNSWWSMVAGASWRHPEGPGSSVTEHPQAPAVQLSRADAQAYARWLGRELPSEDEWEWAARGGGDPERIERSAHSSGDEPRGADGKPSANYWQGSFPDINTAEDGHAGRAPVGCYAANGYGLHDLIGNVWEWTRDAYRGQRAGGSSGAPVAAVAGPRTETGLAPVQAPIPVPLPTPVVAVIKGGSFLCAPDYCVRYRAAARHPQEADLGTSHVGFRTVLRTP